MKFLQWMRRSPRQDTRRHPEPHHLDEAERRYRVAQLNWELEQDARRDRNQIQPPYYG